MKIKKLFIFSLLAVSAVALAGCTKKPVSTEQKLTDQAQIAAEMQKGQPVYCVMTTKSGDKIETWTKSEKSKVYGTNIGSMSEATKKGYMINDGEWVYMWTEGATKGTKYPIMDEEAPAVEEAAEPAEVPDFDMEEELAKYQVEEYDYECKEQNIADSTFVPPSDVEFVDMMKQMEKNMQNMEEGMKNMPESMEGLNLEGFGQE